MRCASVLLILLAAQAACAPPPTEPIRIKGGKEFRPFEAIVFEATNVPSKAQLLWDILQGTADTRSFGRRLCVWAAPGEYRARCDVFWNDDRGTIQVVRVDFTFTVTDETGPGPRPRPPPGPGPKPPPSPDNGEAPIPATGLRVLIVYESAQLGKMPAAQQAIIYSVPLRRYLDSVCTDDPQTGSGKAWWILDQNTNISGLAKLWQDAMKRPKKSVPWLVVSNGQAGFEGPLPADVEQTKALVAKYAVAVKKKGK
jgi:hypothetical protein